MFLLNNNETLKRINYSLESIGEAIVDLNRIYLLEDTKQVKFSLDLNQKEGEYFNVNGTIFIIKEPIRKHKKKSIDRNCDSDTESLDFDFNHSLFQSKILDPIRLKILNEMCKFSEYKKWDLIYRASRDGFDSYSFHRKCDFIPNTLCIISTFDSIFGGFSSLCWDQYDFLLYLFCFFKTV
jgi:hypothetical protein